MLLVRSVGMAMALSVCSCRAEEKHWPVPEDARIAGITAGIVKGSEGNPDVLACRDFTLTEQQVLAVLRNARVLDAYSLHYEFDWAPCVVTGTIAWGNEKAVWQISAMLVAEIRFADGRKVMLGCDKECLAIVYPEHH